jgi:hypothetical protein
MSHRQRSIWNGQPERVPDAFRLTKPKGADTLSGVSELWTHPFGWELRLQVDGHGLQMSSVVRSAPETVQSVENWRAALLEKDWTE